MSLTSKEWRIVAAANLFLCALLFLAPSHRIEDFRGFYTAGVIWRHFPGTKLYDLHLQVQTQRELLGKGRMPFFHPPYEVFIYAPLSLLPFRAALWCWRALSMLTLLLVSYMLARVADIRLKPLDLFLISLSFFPVIYCLTQGQDSILLLAIISASVYLYASGREAKAGAILALGLFKFQFVLPIAMVLALRRNGRFTAGFTIVGTAVAVISLAMVRPEGVARLIALGHQAESNSALGVSPESMPNIHGLISMVAKNAPTASLLTAAISLALILVVGLTRRTQHGAIEFAVATCTATLVSFHMFPHDMVILLLPIALVVARLRAGKRLEHLTVLAYMSTPIYFLCLGIGSFALYALGASALLWILIHTPKEQSASREALPFETVTSLVEVGRSCDDDRLVSHSSRWVALWRASPLIPAARLRALAITSASPSSPASKSTARA